MRIYRSFDMGWFPDPAVCLWFLVYGRLILCFKEMQWYRTIAKDIAKDIVAESNGLQIVTTFCDPSIDIKTGADVVSILDIMENAGVPMTPSINDREMFAHAIHNALQEQISPGVPRIQFLQHGCPNLIKYLPRMKYDEKNTSAMADHKHDHWPVALAYFLMSQIPITKESESHKPRRWMLPKANRGSSAARLMARRLDR